MMETTDRGIDRNFIRQQGLESPAPGSSRALMAALLFQPWIVLLWFVAGWWARSAPAFLALSLTVALGAVLPAWNLFELLYRSLPWNRGGRALLRPAPAPRRFAQGLAAAFAAGIGFSLLAGEDRLALGIAVMFAIAIVALVLGKFCLGSFVFHLVRGRVAFALQTLPWARPPRIMESCGCDGE